MLGSRITGVVRSSNAEFLIFRSDMYKLFNDNVIKVIDPLGIDKNQELCIQDIEVPLVSTDPMATCRATMSAGVALTSHSDICVRMCFATST